MEFFRGIVKGGINLRGTGMPNRVQTVSKRGIIILFKKIDIEECWMSYMTSGLEMNAI
jgi:hypothetical protein